MKKNSMLTVMFFILCVFSYAQDFNKNYNGFDGTVSVFQKNNYIEIQDNIDPSLSKAGEYKYFLEGKIPYFIINGQKILVLHSKFFIYLFASDDQGMVSGIATSAKMIESIYFGQYSSSSNLIEGNIEYLPKFLGYTKPNNPWVEGRDDYGINEELEICWSKANEDIIGLVFSNGFVSYSRPELYLKNARVKKILITSLDGSFSYEVDIDDTPNPQCLKFPMPSDNIKITILDFYPGETWADTCVNFILGIGQNLEHMIDD